MPCLYSEGERETPDLELTCRVFLAEVGAREIHRTELHADTRADLHAATRNKGDAPTRPPASQAAGSTKRTRRPYAFPPSPASSRPTATGYRIRSTGPWQRDRQTDRISAPELLKDRDVLPATSREEDGRQACCCANIPAVSGVHILRFSASQIMWNPPG